MTDPVDLAAIREALTAEQARLRASLGEPIEGPGQMTYGSQAAAATHVFEQQRDLAMRDHERATLLLVDDALARLNGSGYGTCRSCGRSIAPARLEAIPWVALCIECQRTAGR